MNQHTITIVTRCDDGSGGDGDDLTVVVVVMGEWIVRMVRLCKFNMP